MKRFALLAALSLGVVACDESERFAAPAENSPMGPEAICDDPVKDVDGSLSCPEIDVNNETKE